MTEAFLLTANMPKLVRSFENVRAAFKNTRKYVNDTACIAQCLYHGVYAYYWYSLYNNTAVNSLRE